MVTADRRHFFKRSLLSYRRQTYPNKELIIIDDGRQDLSPVFWASQNDDIRYIRIKKDPRNILGHLRNLSLEAANGEIITQWDDDDWYHPDRLSIQAASILAGNDACCLGNTLMHIDQGPFFPHPYISLFKNGTPGSIMHVKDPAIRYPVLPRAEDDVYMKKWRKKRFDKLPSQYAYLFIRCFHGSNTWDRKHFLQQMKNTLPDQWNFYWKKYIQRDLFSHRRFQMDEKAKESFKFYLEDSRKAGIFSSPEPME